MVRALFAFYGLLICLEFKVDEFSFCFRVVIILFSVSNPKGVKLWQLLEIKEFKQRIKISFVAVALKHGASAQIPASVWRFPAVIKFWRSIFWWKSFIFYCFGFLYQIFDKRKKVWNENIWCMKTQDDGEETKRRKKWKVKQGFPESVGRMSGKKMENKQEEISLKIVSFLRKLQLKEKL